MTGALLGCAIWAATLLGIACCVYGARCEYLYGNEPDPLRDPIPPYPPTTDLRNVPVASTPAGSTYHMPIADNHVLCAGVTGSGKGSVLWSLVCGCAPLLDTGHLKLWGLDLKGGMELAIGRDLFEWVATTEDDAATLLERAVVSMDRRTARLADRGLRHVDVTPDEPQVVIVIDEVASITAYAEPPIRRRVDRALKALVSKGRAAGITVLAFTQDPRIETLPVRSLFPMRVALRVAEASEVDMVLGRGALENGAHAHRIPRTMPGTGYVIVAGGTPRRVRFTHYTDADIQTVVDRHQQESHA